jgi:hypothetical protein
MGLPGISSRVVVGNQPNPRKRVAVHELVVASLLALAAMTSAAQVQLPAVNLGDTNFEDGFAEPGWFLQEFPFMYFSSALRDYRGNTIPGANRVAVYSTTTHVAYFGNTRFLGGWLGAEVLQPLVDLDVRLPNGPESRLRGFADLIVGSGLQWAPKNVGNAVFVRRFMLDVGVPTGTYSDKRAVNIGNHLVMVDPNYALTYERKKVEVSARLHYLWNSANNDRFVGVGIDSMQPGQAFHINYAVSYEVVRNLRFGFNGYWLQQLTVDRINGIDVPRSKERTIGLGPGLQMGGKGTWLRVYSYLETGVRNRPSGIKVELRISKALPRKKPEPSVSRSWLTRAERDSEVRNGMCLSDYANFGAADTEGRYFVEDLLDRIFGNQ